MSFRSIAIDGPIGVGKTALAERLAARLDGTTILEERENPFLADFYRGRAGAALQAQLFYLLNRHQQQTAQRQANLFAQVTICDYVFDKDKIFAYLNLDDNELFIYQRLYDLLAADIPSPDLVIYLQAPTDVLEARLEARAAQREPDAEVLDPGADYLRELNEAYQHFFFHYSATPLLVVETSQVELHASDEALEDLVRQITTMGKGTRYYVPRPKFDKASECAIHKLLVPSLQRLVAIADFDLSLALRPALSGRRGFSVLHSDTWPGSRRPAGRWPRKRRSNRAACPRGCGSSVRTAASRSTSRTSKRT